MLMPMGSGNAALRYENRHLMQGLRTVGPKFKMRRRVWQVGHETLLLRVDEVEKFDGIAQIFCDSMSDEQFRFVARRTVVTR